MAHPSSSSNTEPSNTAMLLHSSSARPNSNALIHASVADELILNAGKLSVLTFIVLLVLIYVCTPNDEIMELKRTEKDAAKIAFWMMSLR